MLKKLLEVRDLCVNFHTLEGIVPAVDGVNFDIYPGETLGIVGESGCGKSVTAMSIMHLLPVPPAEIKQGKILFHGEDLLNKSREEMRKINGNKISMIFQEPMTSLNPLHTIGSQIMEVTQIHQGLKKGAARKRAIEILDLVGIPAPKKRIYEYPHQLSGGMRQRVMIAMALVCTPQLLIADEPTTALDVTVQAQIMDLIKDLKEQFEMAVMLITHDLGVISDLAQRVVVMYAGKIVEEGSVRSIFNTPLHPYTQGLINCIPSIDSKKERLFMIEGTVPNPLEMPLGCSFSPRCPRATIYCLEHDPNLVQLGKERRISCWHKANISEGAVS
ncbi:MAG: ABC transporter ATP-binding protein [Bacillota bacterium]